MCLVQRACSASLPQSCAAMTQPQSDPHRSATARTPAATCGPASQRCASPDQPPSHLTEPLACSGSQLPALQRCAWPDQAPSSSTEPAACSGFKLHGKQLQYAWTIISCCRPPIVGPQVTGPSGELLRGMRLAGATFQQRAWLTQPDSSAATGTESPRPTAECPSCRLHQRGSTEDCGTIQPLGPATAKPWRGARQ